MTFGAIALVIAGYLLLMRSNPVRDSLRDGWRCVRRYPVMWRMLAWLGFANALFQFSVRYAMQLGGNPQFTWIRADWPGAGPGATWWSDALAATVENFDASRLPSLEALAGLFNIAVTTFPIAVFAAIGLLVNRRRTLTLLFGSLAKRLGLWVWPLLAIVFACALAVMAKSVLYFWRPPWLGDEGWLRWAPAVMWPAALFECAFGLGVQAWLLLYAYAWVRGMSFDREAMRDVAIRRLGAMAKWAAIVMLAQSVFIELPLALSFANGWPAPPDVVIVKIERVRVVFAAVLVACASVQAWLTLHGETLGRAWCAHWRLVRVYWWEVLWYFLIGGMHLLAVQFLRSVVLRVVDENTAPGIAWTLIWPWISGLVTAWLLASWVCFFKRCEAHSPSRF